MKKLLFLFLLIPTLLWAAAPTRSFTYSSGSTISPSDVTTNEDNIFNYLARGVDTFASTLTTDNITDGTLTTADISGTAGITYGKLSFSNNIVAGDIAADAVGTSEIATSGVASAEILDDTIVNADINSAAAIVDTKLAQITTASKVSTTAITGTLGTSNGGTNATAAANAASGVAVLDASGYLPDISVDTSALKTATSEVSVTAASANLTFTGTSYGFYPQVKGSTAGAIVRANMASVAGLDVAPGTTYVTNITMYSDATGYAQIRYVTASGTDMWVFLLVDKITGEVISASAASDHCSYGNGGDFEKVPHPFKSYDLSKHEIVLVNNDTIVDLKSQVTEEKSLLTLINELYKPDMSKEEVYKPLHSGKYLSEDGKTQTREMVKTIPNYIKVRKLILKH